MEREEGRAAREYILGRGISAGTIDAFRLGYAPADRRWLFGFLSRKGYSGDFLASSGLFSAKYPQSSFFSNRLMFPIADRQGRTLAFGGRLLSGDGPKYINSSESDFYKKGGTLFAIDRALGESRKSKEIYLAEGYMDVIALHQAGVTNAAAPLGTAFTDEQARLLRRWVEKVNLVFDADNAGQTAAEKGILTCRRNGLACAVVIPGQGLDGGGFKDPADILKERGPEVLHEAMRNSIPDLRYLLLRAKALFDTREAEGKARAAAFLFPYLQTLDSEVSRDAALGEAADHLGIDRRAAFEDYLRYERGESKRQNRQHYTGAEHGGSPGGAPDASRARSIRMSAELRLLIAVATHHQYYPQFRRDLGIQEVEDPDARELFIALEECFVRDEAGMEDLLPRIGSEELRNFVIRWSGSGEFAMNPEHLISDGVQKIKRHRLEKRLSDIVVELRMVAAENPGDAVSLDLEKRVEELMIEKKHIDAQVQIFFTGNCVERQPAGAAPQG
jgi:DNA primase